MDSPSSLKELRAADYNPRSITADAFAGLGYSMKEFGDVSGITFNRTTGHLVGGHQRVASLRQRFGDLKINVNGGERGFVRDPEGNAWPVRFVEWSIDKEKAANIAANAKTIGGVFTTDVVGLIDEVLAWNPEMVTSLQLDTLATEFQIPDFDPDDSGQNDLDEPTDGDTPWSDQVECPKCGLSFNPHDPH